MLTYSESCSMEACKESLTSLAAPSTDSMLPILIAVYASSFSLELTSLMTSCTSSLIAMRRSERRRSTVLNLSATFCALKITVCRSAVEVGETLSDWNELNSSVMPSAKP